MSSSCIYFLLQMDFELLYIWFYVLNDIFAKPLIDVILKKFPWKEVLAGSVIDRLCYAMKNVISLEKVPG
ncbi:hypothetical protein OUZ56_027775 [Daphnia magna]|uniref:Uncharacterized protein n=1 Tax=Daphnia magna TaxID=35525 RepID=A0ABR0B1W6_9CRUS|nr:hypothetical protein OUZ56_027775 [Daphnia magna]